MRETRPRSLPEPVADALRTLRRPGPALLVVTALALLARLYALGWRVAHQDEARVGHWILHFVETGTWQYRPIIHGPFLPHVNYVVFSAFGASDFTARLVVALVGGLAPLAAWLLRDRLRDTEVVALGLLLAFNPVLLYYSRFMRNDVPLAVFAFVTFALAVRTIDTGKARYLYAAAFTFALAFTTKENVIAYPVVWAGALALVLDHRLFLARTREAAWPSVLWESILAVLRRLWAWKLPLVVAIVEFAVVVTFFYAPIPQLFSALAHPAQLPGLVQTATLGSWNTFADTWLKNEMHGHPYLPFLGSYLQAMAFGGLAISVLGVLGFLYDRYAGVEPRPTVAFAFYWGVASVLGYPLMVDIKAAWSTAHALAPLALPAAVGLALLYREGRDAFETGDNVAAVAAAVLLLLAAGWVGYVAADTSYVHPQARENPLVQYAQPAGEMQPTLARIQRVAASNQGVDVGYYGEKFYNSHDYTTTIGPGAPGWFQRLPLPWYFERYHARTASYNDTTSLLKDPPPVVIALGPSQGQKTSADLDGKLDGYDRYVYQQYQWSRPMVVYVKHDAGTG